MHIKMVFLQCEYVGEQLDCSDMQYEMNKVHKSMAFPELNLDFQLNLYKC